MHYGLDSRSIEAHYLAMITARLVMAVTIATAGLAACSGDSESSDDSGGEARRTAAPSKATTPATSPSAPVRGEAILIQTRVTDARLHTGEVLDGSVFGESTFCRGGKTSGGSDGATITTTFQCPDGTLRVQFAPTQMSLVQGAMWEVVSGSGSFEGLRGGGSMVAAFDSDDQDIGREVFTGIVGR